MIIDKLINSGILTLSVVLLAIIAIIFLFLKYRQNDGKCKVHMLYIRFIDFYNYRTDNLCLCE